MDENTKKELQSATLDRLISHLRERKDVQNIDLILTRVLYWDCHIMTETLPANQTQRRVGHAFPILGKTLTDLRMKSAIR